MRLIRPRRAHEATREPERLGRGSDRSKAADARTTGPTGLVHAGVGRHLPLRHHRRLSILALAVTALGATTPLVLVSADASNRPLISTTRSVPESPGASKPLLTSAAPTGAGSEPSVAVIGDSLIFQTLAEQTDALRRRGFDPEIHGRPGVPLSDRWVKAQLDAVARDQAVRTVVIATASNDNVETSTRAVTVGPRAATAEFTARLEAAIDQLAGRCVVIVDVRSTSAAIYAPAFAPTTNAAIASVVAGHPTSAVEVDWDAISRPHRHDWFIADELHFEAIGTGTDRHQAGADAYAAAIADGVSRCSRGAA